MKAHFGQWRLRWHLVCQVGHRRRRRQTLDCRQLVLRSEVGVADGHRDLFVPQKVLDRPQVLPIHHQSRSECISQTMPSEIAGSCLFQRLFEPIARTRQAVVAPVQKNRPTMVASLSKGLKSFQRRPVERQWRTSLFFKRGTVRILRDRFTVSQITL
jgi:hypothetical protein